MFATFSANVAPSADLLRPAPTSADVEAGYQCLKAKQGSPVLVRLDDEVEMSFVSGVRDRQFAATDDIFCLFDGHLENLARLRASYGITQHKITEAAFVIEMYKALRDRAPVSAEQALQSFHGPFAFILYDQRNKKVFIAQDMFGKRPLFWGRLKNGNLCVGDDKQMLRAMCSHAVAPYPNGSFFSTALGLHSFEFPGSAMKPIPHVDSATGLESAPIFEVDHRCVSKSMFAQVGSEYDLTAI